MRRVLIKYYPYPHSSEAWLQTRWLWMWWTVKVKVSGIDDVIDWAVDQNCIIIDVTEF